MTPIAMPLIEFTQDERRDRLHAGGRNRADSTSSRNEVKKIKIAAAGVRNVRYLEEGMNVTVGKHDI